MTVANIKALMVSWLDDINKGYFTDAQLLPWINLAAKQVQMELLQAGENWYVKPVETLTVSGQADYVLPTDFIYEHRIEVVLTGTGVNEVRQPLTEITTNQQDYVSISLAPPTHYYIKKDRITVSPTPDQQYTLRLFYSPLIQDVSQDSDSPDVPEQFSEYVALLATFNGFIKDDRAPSNLQSKMSDFAKLLKQMAEDRTQDHSREVVQVNTYDNEFFDVGVW